jgi:hypothetical protein
VRPRRIPRVVGRGAVSSRIVLKQNEISCEEFFGLEFWDESKHCNLQNIFRHCSTVTYKAHHHNLTHEQSISHESLSNDETLCSSTSRHGSINYTQIQSSERSTLHNTRFVRTHYHTSELGSVHKIKYVHPTTIRPNSPHPIYLVNHNPPSSIHPFTPNPHTRFTLRPPHPRTSNPQSTRARMEPHINLFPYACPGTRILRHHQRARRSRRVESSRKCATHERRNST